MSKYKVGDVVYVIVNDRPQTGVISKIILIGDRYRYRIDTLLGEIRTREKDIYPTPESIIKHLLPTP